MGALTAGSFCSGALGLEHGLSQVLGLDLAWVADIEPGPSALLAHHHPDVPNLADLTALDWASVARVVLMCGGYPCTPFSQAGRRKGISDARHIWPYIATGIGTVRPAIVFLENVRGHLTLGFDVVLADLAAMGYDAAWTVVAASDAGAPHARKRLFVLAVRDGLADPGSFPVAVLDGGRWLAPGSGLFGVVPFAGRIPESGVMHAGVMHAGVMPTGGLLPTPAAANPNDGENLASWQARNDRLRATGVNGNGMGTPLAIAVQTLRTPTAQLAVNGGSQHPAKRRAGGHGPTLADEIEHEIPGGWCRLPTPAARDFRSGKSNIMDRNARPLNEVVEHLPTPQSSDVKGSGVTQGRERDGRPRPPGDADLPEAVAAITPRASDGDKGGPNQRGSSGDPMLPSAVQDHNLLPTPRASDGDKGDDEDGDLEAVVIDLGSRKRRKDGATHGQLIIPGTTITPPPPIWNLSATAAAWGKYGPAIARWEAILGRLSPPPTEPGRDGKPRLSPRAVEFMMACPEGWVCDVPGLSRSQMLRILGNGCVAPQAAIAAARLLATVTALGWALPAAAPVARRTAS